MDFYYSNLIPFKYSRVEGIDFLNNKKVAIWHMQSHFNNYLGKFMIRKKYLNYLSNTRLKNQDKDVEFYLQKLVTQVMNLQPMSRLDVYKYFFESNDFRELLSTKTWWKPDIFQ
jgi:hypothetical protein